MYTVLQPITFCQFLLVEGRDLNWICHFLVKGVFRSVYWRLWVPAGHFKGPVDLTGKDHSALSLTELQSWRSKASFIQQIVCSTYRVPPARLLCPPHYWLPAGVLRVGDVWDRRRWLQIHPQCQSIIFDSTHDNAYINFQIFFRARACLCVLRCLSYVMNMSPTYTICGV